MQERVQVQWHEQGIAEVRMVRAAKLNAVDMPMFRALTETGLALAREAKLRAVVLCGEGRAFCSGLDIPALMANVGRKSAADAAASADEDVNLLSRSAESPANFAQRAAWVWRECPAPVIAAVQGIAFGAGLQIALGADLRVVAPDARLSIREMHWGLIPDVTATQTLRHLVGLDVAKELTFTAREVSGAEAKELGMATRLADEPREAALALAREIAARSPSAVRAAKTLWNEAVFGGVEEGLRREEELQRTLIGGKNQLEAVQANLQKRPPAFEDPA